MVHHHPGTETTAFLETTARASPEQDWNIGKYISRGLSLICHQTQIFCSPSTPSLPTAENKSVHQRPFPSTCLEGASIILFYLVVCLNERRSPFQEFQRQQVDKRDASKAHLPSYRQCLCSIIPFSQRH